METIIQNKFLKLDFEEATKTLISVWHTFNDMRTSDYENLFLKYVDAVKKFEPTNLLIDAINAQYAISVETQQWINELVYPLYEELKIKKMAIVMSEHFIAQLSFEQAAEEISVSGMEVEYFVNQNKAMQWITVED